VTRRGVAVVGVGATPITRHGGRNLLELACDAALSAISDADVSVEEIDGYAGTPYAPNPGLPSADGIDQVSGVLIQETLGLSTTWSADLIAMTASAIVEAQLALLAGECTYALVVRAVAAPPRNAAPRQEEPVAAFGREQFRVPYGFGPGPARHAMWWARYMHEHGAQRSDLYEVVAAGRRHAQLNQFAIWNGTPLTVEQYLAGRWIVEPLSLFDCDMPVTAAVAFVLTTRARAFRHAHAAHLVATSSGARPERVFDVACISRREVQVAQLYDGFSPFVVLWLERLGFAAPGAAAVLARGGRISLGGDLPVNTFGGSLGEGRLHGAGHVREAVLQAMGRAGDRQVPEVQHSLAVVGIPESATALLFSPEAA
jgi:acetyl-CoA acetyltransferase